METASAKHLKPICILQNGFNSEGATQKRYRMVSSLSEAPPTTPRRGYPLMQDTRKRRVFAQFAGQCSACGRRHIEANDEIVKDAHGHGWAALRCLSKRDSPSAIDRRTQRLMLAQHQTALGTWGIPDGATPTHSYAEFYELALAKGCCSQHEAAVVRANIGEGAWRTENL